MLHGDEALAQQRLRRQRRGEVLGLEAEDLMDLAGRRDGGVVDLPDGFQLRVFQGLNALSSSIPSSAKATEGKCRQMIDFIVFSSTQSIPAFV